MDELISLRQQSIVDFVVSGGSRKVSVFSTAPEAAGFIRNAALLTHPFYSTCMRNTEQKLHRSRTMESSIVEMCTNSLRIDDLRLSQPRSLGSRENKYGVSSISFDAEGALFAAAGSNGVIRVYDFDECYAGTNLK